MSCNVPHRVLYPQMHENGFKKKPRTKDISTYSRPFVAARTKFVEFPRHPVALVKGAQPGVVMIDVLVEIAYGIQRWMKNIQTATTNYTRHDWLGETRRVCSSTALALGHRTTMLTARLAKHFSAARVARPARYISSSSARRSDALFVVCLLR